MNNTGISLIIPSYRGLHNLSQCLAAIFKQNLPPELLEIIFIINGPDDGSIQYLEKVKVQKADTYTFVIYHCTIPGVSNARNLGITLASRDYIAFLDDDDTISPNYLSSMYALAEPTAMVLAQLINLSPASTKLTVSLTDKYSIPPILYRLIIKSRVLTMNACKLIPRQTMQNFQFDQSLKSSEDMALFSALLISCPLTIKVTSPEQQAIYYRTLRHNSVSWQPISYDFNVRQRLAVISAIYNNIIPKSRLLKPKNLMFFLTRIIGEFAYSTRIIIFNIIRQLKSDTFRDVR